MTESQILKPSHDQILGFHSDLDVKSKINLLTILVSPLSLTPQRPRIPRTTSFK